MLRVIVVDDEPPARRGLRRLLDAHGDVEIVGTAESVAEAAEVCDVQRPDLILLDVTLVDGEGFDLLDRLSPMPLIVLVTASAAHAIRAFEVGALDFLLKPVAPERLALTMDRVRNALSGEGGRAIAEGGTMQSGRMVISEGGNTIIVSCDEIGLLSADADFTRILLLNGRDHLVCRRLGQFEDDLPSPPFVRLGRSLIANLSHVDRIEARGSGGSLLHMNGNRRPVALGRAATQRLRKAVAGL
ncbi:LytR/AlgR family response regulator transcription factor [Tropicimonas isoalkanivorans]|uniref:Two component transcriptional regulator, LytTR family n=1 Tax=Tropicimonas isoalkanivorans TaxID=441112 RepID=A0A1I1HM01_9RHOB|nr:LytTR family DNA-binding domain-containing protein [Tropicimonas isoalkanivorans]SFC24866.1 two component transcriptional regulator, LytTR family [Tropicimonas isoalkanivorans]